MHIRGPRLTALQTDQDCLLQCNRRVCGGHDWRSHIEHHIVDAQQPQHNGHISAFECHLLMTVWMGSARTSQEESRSAASRSSFSWSLPTPAMHPFISHWHIHSSEGCTLPPLPFREAGHSKPIPSQVWCMVAAYGCSLRFMV